MNYWQIRDFEFGAQIYDGISTENLEIWSGLYSTQKEKKPQLVRQTYQLLAWDSDFVLKQTWSVESMCEKFKESEEILTWISKIFYVTFTLGFR